LYKTVQGNNPLDDLKLLGQTIGSLIKGYANAKPDAEFSNPEGITSKKSKRESLAS
jgi:geranylgeranyl reductase